jgi:hypothetical protein
MSTYIGAPGVTHDLHVVGPMAAHIVLPRAPSHLRQPENPGARRLPRAAPQYLQSYLDEFIFRFNRRPTRRPPSDPS